MLKRCGTMARAWCWQSLAGSTPTCPLPFAHGSTGLKRGEPGNCHCKEAKPCTQHRTHFLLFQSCWSGVAVVAPGKAIGSAYVTYQTIERVHPVQGGAALLRCTLPHIKLCGCRAEQLRVAMLQWQNQAMSAAFNCWQDHVVTKAAHSAKVGTAAFALFFISLADGTHRRLFFGTAPHLVVVRV